MSPSSTPEASSDKTKVVVAPVYPSWREFWDSHSFSFPASPLDATSRLQQNLTHFQVNYLHIIFFNFSASIIVAPLMYIIIATTLACFYFYKMCIRSDQSDIDEPPHFIFVSPKSYSILVVAYIIIFTILRFCYGLPWIYPMCLLVTMATFVCLHGLLRVPIYDQYQGLLDAQLQSQPPQVDV